RAVARPMPPAAPVTRAVETGVPPSSIAADASAKTREVGLALFEEGGAPFRGFLGVDEARQPVGGHLDLPENVGAVGVEGVLEEFQRGRAERHRLRGERAR